MTITSQQVDAWDAAVDAAYEAGRQEGMKQERALWELSRLGQEIEACQYAVDVAMPEYRCVGKCQYATPPQRPWVGLTDEEVMIAAYQAGFDIHEDYENEDDPEAMHWWTPDGEACDDSLLKLRDLIEAKLKEKNT